MSQIYGNIAAGLQGVSTITGTVANVRSAKSAEDAYKAEAASDLAAGDYNANLSRDASRRVIGKQQAVIAGAGLSTTSGTPLEIMLESAKQAELEALAIKQTAANRANANKTRAGYAKQIGRNEIAQGAVRGSTILSKWFNDYGHLGTKKSKFSKEELNWIDEANT